VGSTVGQFVWSNSLPFTVDVATDSLTVTGHNFSNGSPVVLAANLGGVLPAPLVAGTTYFVRDVSGDTFKLATAPAAVAIDITNVGTGLFAIVLDNSIFPEIPPLPEALGEIPMLPGNLTTTSPNTEHMSNRLPPVSNGTLWYKTTTNSGNWLGEASNISYATDASSPASRTLFINNLSFPAIGAGAGRANLNTTGRLLLPDTACIDSTNGSVDNLCSSKTYLSNAVAPTDSSTNLLNLNLPYNPHFPSNNLSAQGMSTTTPATTFAVCGGTGNSRAYQTIDKVLRLSNGAIDTRREITIGNCATGTSSPSVAIANFMGAAPTGAFPALTGGTGLRSASLVPGNGIPQPFVGLLPDVTRNSDGLTPLNTDPNQRDLGRRTIIAGSGTVDIAGDAITVTGNNFTNNQPVVFLSTTNALPSPFALNTTYYVRDKNAASPDVFGLSTSLGGPAVDITTTGVGDAVISSNINLSLRATNTYASNKVHVYSLKDLSVSDPSQSSLTSKSLGTVIADTRTLTGTLTFRANCADPVTGADSTCTPTSVRRGPSPVFVMMADSAEDIAFSSFRVKLDGVDPNNIFWVFPRVEAELGTAPTVTIATDVIASAGHTFTNGRPVYVSSTGTLPLPLTAPTDYKVYYVRDAVPGVSYKLSETVDGAAIDLTTAGTGTLTVSAANLTFGGTPSRPSVLTGNFIGTRPNTTSTSSNTTELAVMDRFSSFRGVRFLGFRTTDSMLSDATLLTAMTEVDQPGLLPVLQLHVPNATANNNNNIDQPAAGTSGINGTPTANAGQWTIRPARSEVNVYFVAGNTPSRRGMGFTVSSTIPATAGVSAGTALPTTAFPTGETGGGLANFVRFLENWQGVPIKITGGFIQNTKSRFATAPFTATGPIVNGASDIKTVFMNPALPTATGLSGYRMVYQSRTGNQLPYYNPPLRLWGYDVGLLTQQPDRFAERFAVPIAGSNEFFKEISGDDPWVESLLCALEPNDPTTTNVAADVINVGRPQREGTRPINYVRRALRGSDRRTACDSLTYGTATPSDTVPVSLYE
jgi:uncharacterized Zn-binding protein involved in type VI secretion